MRNCHFCSNSADSKEHAWPLWLSSRFGSESSVLDVQIGDKAFAIRSKHPEVTVRSVCRECNNGWMSRLEGAVRPAIEMLLAKQKGVLKVQEMHLLAAWSLKTSMVFESVDRLNAHFYTQSERGGLRQFLAIPENTWIWIAGVRDFDTVFSNAHRLSTSNEPGSPRGYLTTLVFGNFAAQVLTLRHNAPEVDREQITFETLDGPWADIQLAVWPHQVSGARWPMPMGLRGREGVELWARRFGPAADGI